MSHALICLSCATSGLCCGDGILHRVHDRKYFMTSDGYPRRAITDSRFGLDITSMACH